MTDSPAPSLRRPALEMVALSFIALFQELALIRWLPSQVRVIAYFPNLILISAFLGLGVGSLLARRKSLLWLWPVVVPSLVAIARLLSRVAFTQQSVSEHLWLLYFDLPKEAPVVHGVQPPIVLFFVLSAASFVPLGQQVAQRFVAFKDAAQPLRGYAFDICGSLAGVVAFAVASFLQTSPTVWFVALAALAAVPFAPLPRARWLWLGGMALTVLLVSREARFAEYSPYYALQVRAEHPETGVEILTNGSLHQIAMPLKRSAPEGTDFVETVREGYHVPYRLLGRPPRRALVLGAGTGNDVSVLLDEGAEHVDAVEIDPAILALGKKLHPDRPYDSPKVTAHCEDARHFLNVSHDTYDVIVFGTLDSMTRLSALSNVHLDNFVYTAECIAAARRHLTPDGGMILYFSVSLEFIHEHILAILSKEFGEGPSQVRKMYGLFNSVYMAGPAFANLPGRPTAAATEELLRSVTMPTDDWPYLYLEGPSLSGFYLSLMGILAAISLAAVVAASKWLKRGLFTKDGADLDMFLFGFAFLLMETKCVTQINLIWGATWIASAVVFASVLAMILLSTLLTMWKPMPLRPALLLTIVTLVANYAVPSHWLFADSVAARLALSLLFVGTPIFFASICFAAAFRERAEVEIALGWNLLGAVTGGLLEFTSMVLGLKALSLVAALAYMAIFLKRSRAAKAG